MNRRGLQLRAVAALGAVAMTACANKPLPSLYAWDEFPNLQYEALLHSDAQRGEQIQKMEQQADKTLGRGAALPPGFRAHLGMLYLAEGNPGGARQQWEAEKVAFPESEVYMNRLLQRLTSTLQAPQARNPAPGIAP